MRRQRGMNLIEVAVVISILGILTALALPALGDMVRSASVRNLSEGVQAGLQKARGEALKRNQVVTFWLVTPKDAGQMTDACALSAASGSWVVSIDNPAGGCATAPSLTTAPRIVETFAAGAAGGSLTVAATDASNSAATSVSFNGVGQVVRGGSPIAQIDINHAQASARRLRVQISTSGSVRLCDRDVASTDTRACI